MSYTQRIVAELHERYADQPEFIQAADEVLTSIAPAVDANPAYEQAGLLERLVEPERVVMFRVPGSTMRASARSTAATASSSTPLSAPTRAACASTPR